MTDVVSIQVEGIQLDESMSPGPPLESGCQTPTYVGIAEAAPDLQDPEELPTPMDDDSSDGVAEAYNSDLRFIQGASAQLRAATLQPVAAEAEGGMQPEDVDVPGPASEIMSPASEFRARPAQQLRAVTLGQPANSDARGEIRLGVVPHYDIREMPAHPQQPTPLQMAFTAEGDGGVTGAVGFAGGGGEDGLIGRTNSLEERNKGKVNHAERAVADNLREQVLVMGDLVALSTTLHQKRDEIKGIVQRLPQNMDAIEEKKRELVRALEETEQERAALRDLLLALAPLDIKGAQRLKYSLKANKDTGTLTLKSPKGPVCLVSLPQGPTAVLRWRFKVTEGSSWAIGIVPISKAKDPKYLYDHGTVGLNNSDTRRSATFDRHRLQDKAVEVLFNPMRKSVHFYIEGETHPTLFENVQLAPEGMCLCLCTFLACNVELHQDQA
mmetsp:Transcript_56172/g.132355  ORF Transcript_56172/g.132355 Transcript_56172/m.132355 type:complete len:440 (-) Transcript_56172:105-1424(-)